MKIEKEKCTLFRLGDVAVISAGQGAPQGQGEYCDNGIPFIKAGSLIELINNKSEYEIQKVSLEIAKKYKLKLYKKGSIVFAKSGMSCTKGHVYELKNDCYIVNHLACITPNKISSPYLKYYLQKNKPNRLIKDESYPSISLTDIGNMQINIPQLETQKHIAKTLETASELIALHKKQLEELDNLIKSIFYDMFGDPVTNDKEWEVKKLGEVCENLDSKRIPITAKDRVDGVYPYYGASGIVDYVNDYLFDENLLLISEDGANLLARVSPIAFSVVGKIWVNNHAHVLKFNNPSTQTYIEIFINYIDISNYVTGSAQPKLNQAKLNGIDIPFPPLQLQQKFAEIVTKIEEQKSSVKKAIEESQYLFDSLMNEYFN